jgi:hypothetical protein
MTWWETLPTFAATILVYFLPGLLILAAAGVRRLNLAALAAPVSASVAGSVAIVLPYLGLPFNPVSYFSFSVLLAVLVLALRYSIRHRTHGNGLGKFLEANAPMESSGGSAWVTRWAIPFAVVFPAVIITARYVAGFGSPDSFSESFDNIYHLNAVRHIAETQNGSTLTLGNLTEASQTLYPAAMHDAMALVLMLGAPSVMVAVNVGTIVTGAIVWPLACIFLISRVVGYRPVPLIAAGVLSAGFSSFPYLMVAYGVLYPYHAALAILPVALGLAAESLGMSRGPSEWKLPPLLALGATLPGLALSHPSAAVGLLVLISPIVVASLARLWSGNRSGLVTKAHAKKWSLLTAMYFVATLAIWVTVRPDLASAGWTAIQTNARAVGEVLGSAPMGATTAWLLLILTIAGFCVIVSDLGRYWWIAGIYLIGAVLYIVASSWSDGDVRNFLTGVWYRDSNRLAALLPMVTLPVAVLGAEWIVKRVSKIALALSQTPDRLPRPTRQLLQRTGSKSGVIAGGLVLIALGVGAQGGSLSSVQERLTTVFTTTEESRPLTKDDVALFGELTNIVPPDDMIVANPRTGASLAYAFSGRRVIAPHIFGTRTDQERLLLEHWGEAAYNERVCPAIREMDAYWALDFGTDEIFTPQGEPHLGLRDLPDNSAPGMELVKEVGDSRLFRVTACD